MHAHGVTDNVSAFPGGLTTFPRELQKHGYKTGFIGKWRMGGDSDELRPCFDRRISFRGQGTYRDPVFKLRRQARKVEGYVTDIITKESLRFIRESAARPFLLYMSHKGVHAEFLPAERHKHLYSDVSSPKPKSMTNTEDNYRGRPDWVRRQRDS